MFKNKQSQINNLYKSILLREADEEGFKNYSNKPIEVIEHELLNSQERKDILLNNDILLNMPRELPKNTCVNFWDTDTEELFINNKEQLGEHWVWYNKLIDYQLNSLGYRMKEFSDINWSNYMAVFGCSFTSGVGLSLEDTWSHKISQQMNCDLINASIPGGGNETILINLSRLLSNKNPPKFIIIGWSAITRKCYWHSGNVLLYGSIKQNNKDWEQSHLNYLNNSWQWAFEFLEIKRQVDTLCKLANVPVWHMTNFRGYEFTDEVQKILPYQSDVTLNVINNHAARDYNIKDKTAHPGIEMQDRVVECWKNIKENLLK